MCVTNANKQLRHIRPLRRSARSARHGPVLPPLHERLRTTPYTTLTAARRPPMRRPARNALEARIVRAACLRSRLSGYRKRGCPDGAHSRTVGSSRWRRGDAARRSETLARLVPVRSDIQSRGSPGPRSGFSRRAMPRVLKGSVKTESKFGLFTK